MANVPEKGTVRVAYVESVPMGNADALWTIPAGTTGTAFRDGLKHLKVKLDTPINGSAEVYADEQKLRAL